MPGRWAAVLTLILLAGAGTPRRGETAEPAYDAVVLGEDVYALAGPGPGYYPTGLLLPGRTVTVQGERKGDWVAIRPPKGSFSWIPLESVEMQPDGTGKVVEDAKVMVGSQLSDAMHVYQVKLEKGATVRILDRATRRVGGKGGEWYKILPPKAELRYVRADELKLPGARFETLASPSSLGGDHRNREPIRRPPQARDPSSPLMRMVGRGMIPPAQPIQREQSLHKVATRKTTPAPTLAPSTEAPPIDLHDDPDLPFGKRLQDFQRQLELMRSRTPDMWDIDAARKILLEIRATAVGVEERREALETLEKIERWGRLKQQYMESRRRSTEHRQRDQDLAILQRRVEGKIQRLADAYTAEGVLQRATFRIDDRTTYRLTDSSGETTHCVLTPPGLNVRPYLNSRVGLHGEIRSQRGVPVPVVVVEQLTPLQQPAGP